MSLNIFENFAKLSIKSRDASEEELYQSYKNALMQIVNKVKIAAINEGKSLISFDVIIRLLSQYASNT